MYSRVGDFKFKDPERREAQKLSWKGEKEMEEAIKARLENEYFEQLERFKKEYLDLCMEVGEHMEKIVEAEKRIKVLEALIAFYGELEKGGKENE